jgi:SpoVK/Ycf46/Vps4 family AAA+-type ATPase
MTATLEPRRVVEDAGSRPSPWGPLDWQRANQRYLEQALQRIRLLLERRVLWLRSQGRPQATPLQRLAITDQHVDRLLRAGHATELDFYERHDQARLLGEAIRRLEAALAEQLCVAMEVGSPLPIDILQHGFQLSSFERDVLLLCLGSQLDPAFEALYAYAQEDASRRAPTPYLAHCLFAAQREDPPLTSTWLRAQAPLRRCRLIRVEPRDAGASASLELEERIYLYLQGSDELDPSIADLLSVPAAAPLGPTHIGLVERLDGWLLRQLHESPRPRLNLVGPSDSGKRAIARALCDRCSMRLFLLDLHRVAGAERELRAALEREAVLGQFVLYVDAAARGDEPGSNDLDRAERLALDNLVLRLEAPLILASRKPWRADGPILVAAVERPSGPERRAVWAAALAKEPLTSVAGSANPLDLDRLAEQFDFGPSTVAAITARARHRALLRPSPDGGLRMEDLWATCREAAASALDELAQRIVPSFGWEDIVLPAPVTRQLREIGAQVKNRHRVYSEWDLANKMPRGRGISALFSGPSGTGKTMAAEVLANELGLYLYRVDLSGVVSKYIGETEKNLRRVFDAAEGSGVVLFFDEADALFGKRSEVKDSHDRYANVEIDYLLQRMEEYRGLAILATNLRSHLDSAFLRRLRFVVELPAPDAELRRQIWERSLPASAPVDELDWAALARLRITGGNIRNITVNAAFLAAERGEAIGMRHLMQAAVQEYVKEERLVSAGEFGPYIEVTNRDGSGVRAARG